MNVSYDFRDEVAIITGSNTGLGYQTAAALAGAGARVVLAVRDLQKGKDAQNRIADTITRFSGTVDRVHGVFVFQDTAVYSKGEKPQYVYSVRFAARDLWGQQAAPKDAVYLDLCNDYLEPI